MYLYIYPDKFPASRRGDTRGVRIDVSSLSLSLSLLSLSLYIYIYRYVDI